MFSMNKNILLLSIVLVLAIIPIKIHAVSEAGVIFLTIEPGSRSGGLAQAYEGCVDDGFAGYWNPGAMAFNDKTQIALMHTNWLGDVDGIDDMYYEYLGFYKYFPSLAGNFGMNVTYLTYGEQTQTDENGVKLSTFSSYEVAVAMNYGYKVSDNLGLGANFKFILSDLAPSGTGNTESNVKGRGNSFAFDVAAKGRNVLVKDLDLGVTIQNIGPDITYINEDQADPLPMTLRAGLSYKLVNSKFNRLSLNADINKMLVNDKAVFSRLLTSWCDQSPKKEWDQTIKSIGGEYVYMDMLSLRCGYYNDKDGSITGMCYGAGINYTISNAYKLKFDFAMQAAGELTDYNKTFSLGLEF